MTPTTSQRRPSRALLLAATLGAALGASLLPAATAAQSPTTADAVTSITLGETIAIEGPGAAASANGVDITQAGTYRVTGTIADGMLHVDAPDAAVTLELAGASITNADGPAIYIEQAAEATVTLAPGTLNALADGGQSDQDAALYSVPTVTIGGEGTLEVTAVYEGISSTVDIRIEGGDIRVNAGEDGLNANQDGVSDITVAGGSLYVAAQDGDGIDSNGTIHITGGTVFSQGSIAGANSGIDADGEITITGGTVVATGSMMGIPGATSTQESVYIGLSGTQAAGTLVSLQEAGTELLTFAPTMPFQNLLVSIPGLTDGTSYDVYLGGSTTAAPGWTAFFELGGYAPGELATTVTTELPAGGFRPGGGGGPGGPGNPGEPGGPGNPGEPGG